MSEFLFSCPQCKQEIQCDSSYRGSQISCPVCAKIITAPPLAASGDGGQMIQFKISSIRTIALVGAGVLAAAGIVMLAIHLLAGPKTITFKAFVDGVDVVKLSGKNLWIEHQDFQPPAKMSINGKNWNPIWDKNTSAVYGLKPAFKPRDAESVKLSKRAGRGTVSILEKPEAENDETLSIKLDDGSDGGADWYEFTVSW